MVKKKRLLNMIELFIVLKRDTARNLICFIDISTENIIIIKKRSISGELVKKAEIYFVFIRTHTRTHALVHARACECMCL